MTNFGISLAVFLYLTGYVAFWCIVVASANDDDTFIRRQIARPWVQLLAAVWPAVIAAACVNTLFDLITGKDRS